MEQKLKIACFGGPLDGAVYDIRPELGRILKFPTLYPRNDRRAVYRIIAMTGENGLHFMEYRMEFQGWDLITA